MNYLEIARKTMETIHRRSARSALAGAAPVGPDQVAALHLEDFDRAGLIVRVHSELLGAPLLLVSDDVPGAALEDTDLPIYRSAKLGNLALFQPHSRSVRWVGDLLTIFQGAILDVRSCDLLDVRSSD